MLIINNIDNIPDYQTLSKIHDNISNHQEYINKIFIKNTANHKIYPNFRIEIEWNDKMEFWRHPKGFDLFNDLCFRYFQIDCRNFYVCGLWMLSIYDLIQDISCDLRDKTIIFYNGVNFCNDPKDDEKSLYELDFYVNKELHSIEEIEMENLKNLIKEEIRKEISNELNNTKSIFEIFDVLDKYDIKYPYNDFRLIFGKYTYNSIFHKVGKIEQLIKNRKNSYIISKLKSGEFNSEDVKQYPELIKATDELQKLKIITRTR